MSETYDSNSLDLSSLEDALKFADILPTTPGEEPWMLSDKVFALANGSISAEGLPDELKRLATEIDKLDPLRARELEEEFADIGREVRRYWQAVRDAQRSLRESIRQTKGDNAAIENRIDDLKRTLSKEIQPALDRTSRLQEEIDEKKRSMALAKGHLRAFEEAQAISEDATAFRLNCKLPPIPSTMQKAAIIVAEVVGGAVIGAQYGLASGKVDLDLVAGGDLLQVAVLSTCVVLGIVAMLCMGYVVSARFAHARAEREYGPLGRGWLAHIAIGFVQIAVFAYVETEVVRMGLTNANIAGLMTGSVSAGDLHTLSWVLGVMVSLSVLFAAGTFGWSRLYGLDLRRRVAEGQAAELEARASQANIDSAKVELYGAQELITLASEQVERLQSSAEEKAVQLELAVSEQSDKLKSVQETFSPETSEALRRQIIMIAVKLDEAVRRRRELVNALSPTPLPPAAGKRVERGVPPTTLWQKLVSILRRKRPP